MKEIDIKPLARVGAEIDYVETLRVQAAMKRIFPGIDKTARLRMMRMQAAHARAAKKVRTA